jgi:hypothetical protein
VLRLEGQAKCPSEGRRLLLLVGPSGRLPALRLPAPPVPLPLLLPLSASAAATSPRGPVTSQPAHVQRCPLCTPADKWRHPTPLPRYMFSEASNDYQGTPTYVLKYKLDSKFTCDKCILQWWVPAPQRACMWCSRARMQLGAPHASQDRRTCMGSKPLEVDLRSMRAPPSSVCAHMDLPLVLTARQLSPTAAPLARRYWLTGHTCTPGPCNKLDPLFPNCNRNQAGYCGERLDRYPEVSRGLLVLCGRRPDVWHKPSGAAHPPARQADSPLHQDR